MLKVYPDYYKDFECIADKCKHNCCIGWEIDIDKQTADHYKNIPSALSERFRSSVDFSGDTPHFILAKDERCPFLNSQNLCDIITHLGEESLCTICAEHPRFHNELPGRVESGIGMCCEEAARLILSKKEPVTLIYEGSKECEDEIIDFRDKVIEILQNREKSIFKRLEDVMTICDSPLPHQDLSLWADAFLHLERLDKKWTELLLMLKEDSESIHLRDFDTYMQGREAEYEQLCVYLVYRHLANAPDMYEATLRAKFAALSYFLLRNIGAMLYTKDKHFTLAEQVELCRMYSAEIEYSDENLYILLDELE